MRITILLLILSIIVAYPKYKEARSYYDSISADGVDARECGTMSGMYLSNMHEGYGILATATSYDGQTYSFYVNEGTHFNGESQRGTMEWKVMGSDAFTGYTCTVLKGNAWFYSSVLGVL